MKPALASCPTTASATCRSLMKRPNGVPMTNLSPFGYPASVSSALALATSYG